MSKNPDRAARPPVRVPSAFTRESEFREICPAERMLMDEGFLERPVARRRRLISCLGCRWLTQAIAGQPVVASVDEIERCSGLDQVKLEASLNELAELGILSVVDQHGPVEDGRVLSRLVVPDATDIGRAFWAKLEYIETACRLPAGEPQHGDV